MALQWRLLSLTLQARIPLSLLPAACMMRVPASAGSACTQRVVTAAHPPASGLPVQTAPVQAAMQLCMLLAQATSYLQHLAVIFQNPSPPLTCKQPLRLRREGQTTHKLFMTPWSLILLPMQSSPSTMQRSHADLHLPMILRLLLQVLS